MAGRSNTPTQVLEGWLTVALYTALIFTLSSIPNLSPPGAAFGSDKVTHLVEYGIWGLLIRRALERVIRPAPPRLNMVLAVVSGAALCYLDESFQRTVGRNFSWYDMAADVVGVILAQFLYDFLIRRTTERDA